jgi:hypothetical protein
MKKYVNNVVQFVQNESKHWASTWFQLNAAHKNSFVILNRAAESQQDREKYESRKQAPFVGGTQVDEASNEDFFLLFSMNFA